VAAKLARTTHALLYLVLFLMPITGFLYAMGGTGAVLRRDLARFVPVNKPVAELFSHAHLSAVRAHVTVLLRRRRALPCNVRKDGITPDALVHDAAAELRRLGSGASAPGRQAAGALAEGNLSVAQPPVNGRRSRAQAGRMASSG
jgi:hypothetical protein